MENVHKEYEKIQLWWVCKNFIQNIGLKEHITAIHEERDSIVINVAKILLEDAIWNYFYKMFMKLIHEFNCEHCGKNFTKAFNL